MSCKFEFVCFLAVIGFISADNVYYVSSDKSLCRKHTECRNISFYLEDIDSFFHDNVVIQFLGGTHTIVNMKAALISQISNLTLQGPASIKDGGDRARITCTHSVGGFVFLDIRNLSIRDLTFHNCGSVLPGEVRRRISNFTLNEFWTSFYSGYSRHCILLADIMYAELHQVMIHNCTGRALSALNTFNVTISEVDLSHSNLQSCNSKCSNKNSSCFGGNAYFLYVDRVNCWPDKHQIFYLKVTNSNISSGINMASELFGGGLGVGMYHSASYGVDVLIDSVIFNGNTGYRGANIHFSIASSVLYYSVILNNVISVNGNAEYPITSCLNENDQWYVEDEEIGGGIYYNTGLFLENHCPRGNHVFINSNKLLIMNSKFLRNIAERGGGAWIGSRSCDLGSNCFLKLDNITVADNMGVIGSGLSLKTIRDLKPEYEVYYVFNEVKINDNVIRNTAHNFRQANSASALYISQCTNVTVIGLQVTNHENQTGIYLFDSDITIEIRDTLLENNTAKKGAGILLYGSSHIILGTEVILWIKNNRADDYGGAMYVDREFVLYESPLCFFQNLSSNTSIYATKNSADKAGDILYSTSGAVFNCSFIQLSHSFLESTRTVEDTFLQLLHHDGDSSRIIATGPVKACFCDKDVVNCSIREKVSQAILGDHYNISIATVGLFDVPTPGYITHQEREYATDDCTMIRHPATYNNHSDYFITARSTLPSDNRPLEIKTMIQDCPIGFALSGSSASCECNNAIKKSKLDITCDVHNHLISREGNNWISYDIENQCTMIHKECPLDFCDDSMVTFNISQPDPQCALNRSGTLCGKCRKGLSLILGSNECRKCSNYHILLLIPFAVAGIALVILLIYLNLTISVGTINGLIFYANIVKMNESVLFQNQSIPVLTQFISWITLDLGIPTCFVDGLDMSYKTWLQFVFPIYIWCVIIVIIILANRYKTIAKLVGDNPISVLATLLLLSYTKILRTVILAMLLGHISCENEIITVWLLDGSIEYFKAKHGFLCSVAILVFVFVCVPFTLVHLLIRVIERHVFKYSLLSRIHMIIKPYFDAVGGPYKDEYRFWGGFLLLIRLVIALTASFAKPTAVTSAILTAVIIIMLCGWSLQGVYQKWYNNLLESWFLLNLGIINIIGLNQGGLIWVKVSVSLVFVTFLGIVAIHVLVQINKSCNKQTQLEMVPLEEVKPGRRNTLTKVYNTTYKKIRKMSTQGSRPKIVKRERSKSTDSVLLVKNRRESLLSITLLEEGTMN